MTRSLEALRVNALDLAVREKGRPETEMIVATCPSTKARDLLFDTVTLAFELMEVMPDRAAGITLQ